MSKTKRPPSKKVVAQDGGAPLSLVTSVIIGFPLLAFLTAAEVWRGGGQFLAPITYLVILLQGLCICFYWRRLKKSVIKTVTARLYLLLMWVYIVGYLFVSTKAFYGMDVSTIFALGGLLTIGLVGMLFALAWGQQAKGRKRLQVHTFNSAVVVLGGALFMLHGGYLKTEGDLDDFVLTPEAVVMDKDGSSQDVDSEISQEEIIEPASMMAEDPYDSASMGRLAAKALPSQVDTMKNDSWSYGNDGPDTWHRLSPLNKICADGNNQSPVDLPKKPKRTGKVQVSYRPQPLKAVDNGRAIQLLFEKGSWLKDGSLSYTLKSLDFHSPSEHTVNGIHYPLEVQLKHIAKNGQVAILSILVEQGRRHPQMDRVLDMIAGSKDGSKLKQQSFNPLTMIPLSKNVHRYEGSLTTPPCTEGVNWFVGVARIQMSKDQIVQIKEYYNNNARPVQPMAGRVFF